MPVDASNWVVAKGMMAQIEKFKKLRKLHGGEKYAARHINLWMGGLSSIGIPITAMGLAGR